MANDVNTTLIVAQVSSDAEGGESSVQIVESTGGNNEEAIEGVESLGEELSEGTEAEGESIFPPFDTSTFGPQLFWLALTFGALYLVMSRLALPRIGEILEVRRDRVEGDLAEADRLRKKTDAAISAYETELADARAKSHGIAEDTRAELKSTLDNKRQDVEAELARKVSQAETRIQKTKTQALANVDDIAADTAVALVSKLTGKVSVKAARGAVASVVKG